MSPREKRPKVIVIAEYLKERAEFRSFNQVTPCEARPDLFVDYPKIPSLEEAKEMCAPCPFERGDNPCLEYAEATKPQVGVWGGVAWKDGRPQTVRSVAAKAAKTAA